MQFHKRALVAVALTLTATGLTGTATVAPASAATSYADRVEASITKYTNAQRTAHARRAVSTQACVDGMAERWAQHLADTNRFEHRNLYTIMRKCNKRYASENIAKYPVTRGMTADQTAKAIVRMWMNSSGHRANILASTPRTIGVGVRRDGNYWVAVENFAS